MRGTAKVRTGHRLQQQAGLLAGVGPRVEVTGADKAVYERMRTAIPALLASYAGVAALFAPSR